MQIPVRLVDFDNKLPVIDSIWLRNEIDKIRPSGISPQGFSNVRKTAQVQPHLNTLTVNDSVKIVFVALYKPNGQSVIKKSIAGPNLNDICVMDLNIYVDQWIGKGCLHGRNLVKDIISLQNLTTVSEFQNAAKTLGQELDMDKVRSFLGTPRNKRLTKKTKFTPKQSLDLGYNIKVLIK